MSAGVCGKRVGIEEIFGSPSSPPSSKRSRCSLYGSPIRPSDYSFGSEDALSVLLRMFPTMDREVVETILNAHDNKLDDAIKGLHALCLGDVAVTADALNQLGSTPNPTTNTVEGSVNTQASQQKPKVLENEGVEPPCGMLQNGSSWVDIFVQEMKNASNWDDVRVRTTRILEAFERIVVHNCRASEEQEISLVKEQLQHLLKENQILKKAVAIQHERNVDHEEKLKEVEQLKQMIAQYQEQVRTLEINNYSLKIHLQRAQEANSIPSHFNPDVF